MLNKYLKNVEYVFEKTWISIKMLNKYLKIIE